MNIEFNLGNSNCLDMPFLREDSREIIFVTANVKIKQSKSIELFNKLYLLVNISSEIIIVQNIILVFFFVGNLVFNIHFSNIVHCLFIYEKERIV